VIDYGNIVESFSFEKLVLEDDEADLFVICMQYSTYLTCSLSMLVVMSL
jgi:hypothetical protein